MHAGRDHKGEERRLTVGSGKEPCSQLRSELFRGRNSRSQKSPSIASFQGKKQPVRELLTLIFQACDAAQVPALTIDLEIWPKFVEPW